MAILFIRCLLLYSLVLAAMKLMGKRQLGQLQPFELVAILIISEMASLSIQSNSVPLLYSVIPIVTITLLQIMVSLANLKSQRLRDLICGRENPCAQVFDPGRFDGETLPGVLAESGQAVKGLAKRVFQIPAETAGQLAPGHGGVVFLEGEKLGVYKDEDGTLYPVELQCPHLGCQLEWNPDEKSWDCPCHGSRFDRFGTLISGPAQTGTHARTEKRID